jgi:hypothetical protein
VTFTVNANNLAVGTYGPFTITFTNADTGQGTQTRTATLTVSPLGLQVTPGTNIDKSGNIVVSGTQGGPFSPTSEVIEVAVVGQQLCQSPTGIEHAGFYSIFRCPNNVGDFFHGFIVIVYEINYFAMFPRHLSEAAAPLGAP